MAFRNGGSSFSPAAPLRPRLGSLPPAVRSPHDDAIFGHANQMRRKQAIVFNDRYGMNRLYFHEKEDGFYFASEAKALLKILPELRQLDLRSASEFFSCGCVLQGRTLFQNISQIPGGVAWVISPGTRLEKKAYFKKEQWENQETLSPADYYNQLRAKGVEVYPPADEGWSLT